MSKISKFGVQQQLTFAVFLSVLLAAFAIIATLFFFNQQRSYRDTVRQSEEMVQAASLAFSQAMRSEDEILLDALLHELQSRDELHIRQAYVLGPDGKVVAHSLPEEYGRIYEVPDLLAQEQPPGLSEVSDEEGNSYRVVSLLQADGAPIGALVISFSANHLSRQIRSEMLWIAGVTVAILLLSGLGVMAYGRQMVGRLGRLQEKAAEVGRGKWDEPIEVVGSDEVSRLAETFNKMLADLSQLRERDRQSAETIQALNRDLRDQLEKVKQLKEQLADENAVLRRELKELHAPGEIIGSNTSLRELLEQARQVASLPITVLIMGESGTGKELLAAYLHESGNRSGGPFVRLNCAAIPVSLVESELFGHEKGAFTGAVGQKKGMFEMAHGGTLFLDEVGDLPLEAQAKLLRALQQGEVQRVGSDHMRSVDVRVVAATNRDLSKAVAEGTFREDLYYRLKVMELVCPPLRERLQDLPALAQHFVEYYSRKLEKPVLGISPSALKVLSAYAWPGNVRELENLVARAVALANTQVLGVEDFSLPVGLEMGHANTSTIGVQHSDSPFEDLVALCGMSAHDLGQGGWDKLLDACERICLEAVLKRSKNQKEAAKTLGLTPTKLHRLIRKHKIKLKDFSSYEV